MVWKPNIVGIINTLRRPVTIQYPFEKLKVSENYRGVPAVNPQLCTSCGRCVDVCPNKCTIFEDYNGKKVPNLYAARCMFCGLCVEVCPTGARVNTPLYELAAYKREATVYSPAELYEMIKKLGKLSERKDNKVSSPTAGGREERCIACLECERACPVDAISHKDINLSKKKAKREIKIDYGACIFCGKCIEACPENVLYYFDREDDKKESFSWIKDIPAKPKEVDTYYHLLEKEVIEPRFCSHCTACITVCPVNRISGVDTYIHEIPEIPCTNCSLCYRVCPRVAYQNPKGMGSYIEFTSARSRRFEGQDGAIGTESLVAAFELGIIDTAIILSRTPDWKPVIRIARNKKELLDGLKSKYTTSDMLTGLKLASRVARKGIGMACIPCQEEGLENILKHAPHLAEKVKFVLGLFCFENFYWHKLHKEFFAEKHGIDLRGLIREDIRKGRLTIMVMDIVTKEGRKYEWRVKELEEYALEGCEICQHFTNINADISVGGAGSELGYNTVFIRTETGKRIFDYLREKGYIEEVEDEEKKKEAYKGAEFLANLKIKQRQKALNEYFEVKGMKKGEKE